MAAATSREPLGPAASWLEAEAGSRPRRVRSPRPPRVRSLSVLNRSAAPEPTQELAGRTRRKSRETSAIRRWVGLHEVGDV